VDANEAIREIVDVFKRIRTLNGKISVVLDDGLFKSAVTCEPLAVDVNANGIDFNGLTHMNVEMTKDTTINLTTEHGSILTTINVVFDGLVKAAGTRMNLTFKATVYTQNATFVITELSKVITEYATYEEASALGV